MKWTNEEIIILEDIYPSGDWDKILMTLPNHPKSSIIDKASTLNIKVDKHFWNNEELQILKDNYGKVSLKEIKKLLPLRTSSSIKSKAIKMNLTKDYTWTDVDNKLLIELYPIYKNKELEKIFNRTKEAIGVQANSLGLTKDLVKYKERKDDILKEKLIIQLQDFAKDLNRTPMEIDFNERPDLPGYLSYYRYFGSYAKACALAGLTPNSRAYGKNNIQIYVASNGDICYSAAELKITEFLISNSIIFKKEVYYRDIMNDARCKGKRCDWLLNDNIIVEYFGMHTKDFYKIKMEQKIVLCQENDIRLIPIYVFDLNKLNEIFAEFM